MADQANIFGNEPGSTPPANGGSNPPNVDPNAALATLLSEIKNERGEQKYKTLNDALIALKHSQEHIPNLAQQVATARAEAEEAKREAAKIAQLETTLLQLVNDKNTPSNQGGGLTEEVVAKLVTETLTKTQQAAKAKQNTDTVVNKMREKFGADAQKVFEAKAIELDMTVADFVALAGRSPQLVLKAVGLDAQAPAPTGAPGSSVVNTIGLQPTKDSKIGPNTASVQLGATTEELGQERKNAVAMVEEVHARGLTMADLSDPKVYRQYFGSKGK